MTDLFTQISATGELTGNVFQPGLPPLRDPLRYIGWRRVADHWEIVSMGLSEFAGKETSDPTRSGFGIEFVLRIGVKPNEEFPPDAWTNDLFMPLARMVFWSSQVPRAGSVLSFEKTETYEGNSYRVYDEANPFDTSARPLDFVKNDGFLATVHQRMRTARPGHDDLPPKAGFGVWNTPVAQHFSGLGFVNDETFGVMNTDTGPVQWVRCVPLMKGETIASFPRDGILRRG